MPVNLSGDAAFISVQGAYNDVAGNQYITYTPPATADSRLREIQQILKLLEPADMDATHREECLDGTRTEITQFVLNWANDRCPKQRHTALVLCGVAGSGKSTIATTIASRFRAMGCLGAFLFFERDATVRSDPSTVIRTIAYKLGVSHERLGEAIAANVKRYPEIIHFPLRAQFQHLLVGPMTSEGVVDPAFPVVIVLDALDECGDPDTRATLLELLAEEANRFPALVMITTRPLPDISGFFKDHDHILLQDLDITTQHNTDDISKFLMHNIKRMRKKYPSLRRRNDWPGRETFLQLVNRASGLFIWASTACRFIDQHPVDSRLQIIIRGASASTADDTIDALYRTALEVAGSWDNPEFVSDFRAVLGFILVARRPLAADDIISLLGNSVTEGCIDAVSQLGCVLQFNPKARLLHPSFADFLFTRSRCNREYWFFDQNTLHHDLATRCIYHLSTSLKTNICNLTLSPQPVDERLSDDLEYACLYWVDHVCRVNNADFDVTPSLRDFLFKHLLHWLEAMSILKMTRDAIGLLPRLSAWLSNAEAPETKLLELVNDGVRFVRRHVDLIETHPLLVYSSALPFTPPNTLLYKTFHNPLFHPVLSGTVEQSWSPLLQALRGHSRSVLSVAIASDGTRIVSGSDDETIRVWDATSGIEVLPALTGHGASIVSVAFSPDGTRIASGSWDCTVRLWDASSGVEALPPMRGHTDGISSVVFSPDGQLIISGSHDKTVRLWDANSGAEVRHPLKGHSKGVTSVSCSQTRIASGSQDSTIRVWDIELGLQLLSPLQGHTDSIYSIAFSPSGKYIASGSGDDTIRLWDSTTGAQILPPFEGHSRVVLSVAFSRNGTHIVSGSEDKTIRVWEVTTGAEVIPPLAHNLWINSVSFSLDGTRIISGSWDSTVQIWDATSTSQPVSSSEGHNASVNSVTFSPDGIRLVTGSDDMTARIWDTASGVQLLPPLSGHSDWILCVEFSPDGTRIVSGSSDTTVRVWDVMTGLEILPALRGHRHLVRSVAFSPDGRRIISGSNDETVRVWDATTGLAMLPTLEHEGWVLEVAFSSDGRHVISRDWLRQYTWDAASGTLISNTRYATAMPRSGDINFDSGSRWVTDRHSDTYLSKIPSSFGERSQGASNGRKLAVGTGSGEVFLMRFPRNC